MRINWNRKRRWIALLMLLAGIGVMLLAPPVIPVIQLPGERFPEGWDLFGLRVTNSLLGSLVAWILVVLLAVYVARRRPRTGNETPRGGFYNAFEMLFEGLYNFVSGIASGPFLGVIFKMFMTIFLIVLLSNWLELIPGVDSIGFIEPHLEEVYDPATGQAHLEPTSGYEIYPGVIGWSLNGKCPWVGPEAEAEGDAAAEANAEAAAEQAREQAKEAIALAELDGKDTSGMTSPEADAEQARQQALDARQAEKQSRRDTGCVTGIGALAAGEQGEATGGGEGETTGGEETAATTGGESTAEGEGGGHEVNRADPVERASVPWVVLPFLRAPSTDLNMTLSLALAVVFMTQVMGFRALGPSYLTKFFNFKTLFKSPLGGIDLAVGLLELIGEIARILSFSFRLLGNIFAGSILLFVMSFLVPFLPWPFFILEFFVGIIQAAVFGLLGAIFMNLATIGHHGGEEHEGEHGQ